MKVGVLMGGDSSEREISLLSGKAVSGALRTAGHRVIEADPRNKNFLEDLKKTSVDIVFIALHGAFGEDGTVQRLLDRAKIPYTGSGAASSANCFDKTVTYRELKKAGLRTPEFFVVAKGEPLRPDEPFPFPWVVKPACAGSSVGITLVKSKTEYPAACRNAFAHSDRILVDRYVEGRELTVGLLGQEALPPGEIVAQRAFYDYQAKYQDTGTRYLFPAPLEGAQTEALKAAGFTAYKALGCEVMARVDFIVEPRGAPVVLEINTIPGLTGKSLLPKAAQSRGIDFPALCDKILDLSIRKYSTTPR